MTPIAPAYAARFWAKVDKAGDCWTWTASLNHGYGQFNVGGKMLGAHRLAYQMLVGPVPEGLQLDHLCRNRACVNPSHLEPVTQGENMRRGTAREATRLRHQRQTHCKYGHPFSLENVLGLDSDGGRICGVCRRTWVRRYVGAKSPSGIRGPRRLILSEGGGLRLLECGHILPSPPRRTGAKRAICPKCEAAVLAASKTFDDTVVVA